MLFPLFVATLGGAFILDSLLGSDAEYGYGESTLPRIPKHIWASGGFGIRGVPASWRDNDPRFGGRNSLDFGYGPLPPVPDAFGVATGAAGIRGVSSFPVFTPAQQAAMRRDQAAQGFRAGSVSPGG